jgi:hypothetical protein
MNERELFQALEGTIVLGMSGEFEDVEALDDGLMVTLPDGQAFLLTATKQAALQLKVDLDQPPSPDDAFDIYLIAYHAKLSIADQHPCIQAAVADVHEGLDDAEPISTGISPSRFTRAYQYRLDVWASNPAGRAKIQEQWPVVTREES